jgi:hypothetical protein
MPDVLDRTPPPSALSALPQQRCAAALRPPSESRLPGGKNDPPPPPPQPAKKGKGVMKLARTETLAIADEMKRTVSGSSYSFLVATLRTADEPRSIGREKQISNHELIDDREVS